MSAQHQNTEEDSQWTWFCRCISGNIFLWESDCLRLCGKKQNLNIVPAALCVGFKAPDYHKTAKSAFSMSLEYAEYVEPASPESASGYEDKRLQCNPQKGQPQHSLTPGVPTSPPRLSRQHKVTSANAFSILMQASRRGMIKSKNFEARKEARLKHRITYSLFLTLRLCLSLTPSPSFSFCFNPSLLSDKLHRLLFSCLDAAEGGFICCLLQSIKFPQTDLC